MPEIALFGGSFDPPHLGHVLAAAFVLATEPVDELWLVPVLRHPFQKPLLGPFDHRVALCEKAVADLRRAKVSRAEEEIKGQGRTVDLLEHLHKKHPGTRWALVLGSDLEAETRSWKRFDRVEQLARVVKVPRGGHSESPAAIPAVSSTEVRALLRSGGDVSQLVPLAVADAIRDAGT